MGWIPTGEADCIEDAEQAAAKVPSELGVIEIHRGSQESSSESAIPPGESPSISSSNVWAMAGRGWMLLGTGGLGLKGDRMNGIHGMMGMGEDRMSRMDRIE
jgi:hypothetical protein